MSRKDRSRKKARKARRLAEHEAELRAEDERRLNPPSPTPVNHSRLRQVFGNLSFRSHERGGTKPFSDRVLGPTVKASTPEELVERTDEAYVEEALKQKPS